MKFRYNKERDENGLLLQDKEVMRLLLMAKTRKQICAELRIPMGTVNTCCSRIYENNGCNSQTELILKCSEKGFSKEIQP